MHQLFFPLCIFSVFIHGISRFTLETATVVKRKLNAHSVIFALFVHGIFSAEDLLTSPGSIHEVETTLVDGRLHRVYKNLWPSLRDFWLFAVAQYSGDVYIVYEDQRLTYGQVHTYVTKVAGLFRDVYGIKKGLGPISSLSNPSFVILKRSCFNDRR